MASRDQPQSFDFTAGESVALDFVADADITGATVHFWMARERGSPVLLSTDNGTAVGTVIDSLNFSILVTDEDTEALIGTYVYEVELDDVGGNKSKAAHGYLTFAKQVEL